MHLISCGSYAVSLLTIMSFLTKTIDPVHDSFDLSGGGWGGGGGGEMVAINLKLMHLEMMHQVLFHLLKYILRQSLSE